MNINGRVVTSPEDPRINEALLVNHVVHFLLPSGLIDSPELRLSLFMFYLRIDHKCRTASFHKSISLSLIKYLVNDTDG